MKKKNETELLQQHTADCSHSNSHGNISGGSTALPLSPIKELKRCISHMRAYTHKEKQNMGRKRKEDVNYGPYLC